MTSPKRLAAMGGGLPPTYIEDVFSTWLYTGNGANRTITNGIDLAGKGGLVWIKSRNGMVTNHVLSDTARGVERLLYSSSTSAQVNSSSVPAFTGFLSSGFTLGPDAGNYGVNNNTLTTDYVSWTFRKQPKFFDVVTWTGDSASSRTIQHSLGSTPGCIIIKRTSAADSWWVVHRAAPGGFDGYGELNSTAAFNSSGSGVSSVNSTSFTVNAFYNGNSSTTWVAYLFAHDAGGFGLTGTDNVISCGSFSSGSPGNNTTVNLGYEPQWIIFKNTQNGSEGWWMYDTMRGWTGSLGTAGDKYLFSNSSGAEGSITNYINVTSTGFVMQGGAFATDQTFIYIAIRRGPMRTPTSGTSVFRPALAGDTTSEVEAYLGRPVDLWAFAGTRSSPANYWRDRLRGGGSLETSSTSAEFGNAGQWFASNIGANTAGPFSLNTTRLSWVFGRAPGFFDVVCYTGTGVAGRTVSHGLAAVPQLIIVKQRSSPAANWIVYSAALGPTKGLYLDLAAGQDTADWWNNTAPTTSVFSVGPGGGMAVNDSGATYVAYLFASCPGVSKVGSYTGNGGAAGTTGTGQTINCGFTNGARFVMIKRTDSTGNWCVWDSARGIVAANDPTLALNLTSAEATSYDFIDADSSGFTINQVSAPGSGLASNMNVTGATYIYLAIA